VFLIGIIEAMKEALAVPTGDEAEKPLDVLRAELIATGKVEKFIDAEPYEAEEIPEGLSKLGHAGVELIDMFFAHDMVIDSKNAFEGHRARRVWRTDLPLDQRRVYENNAIRRNLIGGALSGIELVLMESSGTEVGGELKEEFEVLFKEFEVGWEVDEENPDGTFTTEEKMDFVNNRLKPFMLKVRQAAVEK